MSLIDNIKNYTKEYALPIGVSSTIIFSPFLDNISKTFYKVFKPTYAQVIEKIAENNYKVMENKSGKTAILFHKVNGIWKFDPNNNVLNSIKSNNPNELQEWYNDGLIKKVEEIKEPEAKFVSKFLIENNVKPFLVKEGYAKQYTIPLSESQKKNLEEKEKKMYETTKKGNLTAKIEETPLIPSLKDKSEKSYDKNNIKTWQDNQLKESYKGLDAIVKNGVPPATKEEKEMKKGVEEELNNRGVDPDTLDPLLEQPKKIYPEERIEKLRLIQQEIPNGEGKLKKELEEAYNFLKTPGYSQFQQLLRATTVDSLGNIGFRASEWIGDVNGDGIVDKPSTYEDIGSLILKAINLGKAGRMGEGDEGYKYINTFTYKVLIPLNERIKGRKINPNELQINEIVNYYSENPEILKWVEEQGLKPFMNMVGYALDPFVFGRLGRDILGYDEKYDTLKLKYNDVVQGFAAYKALKDIEDANKDKELSEALRKGELTQNEYNTFKGQAKQDSLSREENFRKLEDKLREEVKEERVKAVTAIKITQAEKDSLTRVVEGYNSKIDSLTALVGKKGIENKEYQEELTNLKNKLNELGKEYGNSKKSLTDFENKNYTLNLINEKLDGKLTDLENKLNYEQEQRKLALARADSLSQVAQNERIRAKEAEIKAQKAEERTKIHGGVYIGPAFYDGSNLLNIGAFIGHKDWGYLRIGKSTTGRKSTKDVLSNPTYDPLRKLDGVSITEILRDINRDFLTFGYAKDIKHNGSILQLFADIGSLKSDETENVKEILEWMNKKGEVIARDVVPKGSSKTPNNFLFDFGANYFPNIINKNIPFNLGIGAGVGISKIDTFLLLYLLAGL